MTKTRLIRWLRRGTLVAAAALTLGACDEKLSDITGPTPNLEPTLSSIQREIFSQRCTACHNGTRPFLPFVQNLTDGNSYANLVGVPSIQQPGLMRVAPGDPDNSYIVHKLEGRSSMTGLRMPLTGPPYLTDGQILVIRRWIQIGAPNN